MMITKPRNDNSIVISMILLQLQSNPQSIRGNELDNLGTDPDCKQEIMEGNWLRHL